MRIIPDIARIRSSLRALPPAIADWLKPPSGYRIWLFPGVSLALCVATLTAIGPAVQQVVSSALNTRAPSLYAAAYKDEIVNWPRLDDWLLGPYNLLFVAVGVASALLALRRSTIREIAVSMGGWVAALLIVADAVVTLRYSNADVPLPSMTTNVAANVAGGAAVGFIVFLALACGRLAPGLGAVAGSRLARSAVIVGAGLVTTATTYFVLTLLYQPVPVALEAILKAPASGWFASDATSSIRPQSGGETPPFSPLPTTWPVDELSISTPVSPLRLDWAPGLGRPLILEVRFYTDCIFKGPKQLRLGRPTLLLDARRAYSIGVDSGGFVDGSEIAAVKFAASSKRDISMFFLSKDAKGSGLKVTRFDGPGQSVTTTMREASRLSVGVPLYEPKNKSKVRSPRTFTFSSGGVMSRLTFRPSGTLERDLRQRCDLVPQIATTTQNAFLPAPVTVPATGIGVVALFTLKDPADIPSFSLKDEDPALTLSGVNGWSTASGFGDAANTFTATGSTRAITFSGAVSELQVNGEAAPARPYDEFIAKGALSTEYVSNGALRLHGTADQLWRNGQRLNPTRWERASTEWQVFAVGALAALLLGIWRLLWPAAAKIAGDSAD